MDENNEVCLGLGLGLGLSGYVPKRDSERKNKRVFFLDLSIPLHPNDHGNTDSSSNLQLNIRDDEKQESKNSFSSGSKEDDGMTNYSNNCSRKKLRLTSDQTTLLEDSFRQHNTLNTAQKLALAEKLHLKPRQVEVWFQNRRARTKLKQTERDCEFLKKNCERLSEENRRLRMELLELRSTVKPENPLATAPLPPPFFYQISRAAVATLKTCPSCEKIDKCRGGSGGGKQESVAMDVVHEPTS